MVTAVDTHPISQCALTNLQLPRHRSDRPRRINDQPDSVLTEPLAEHPLCSTHDLASHLSGAIISTVRESRGTPLEDHPRVHMHFTPTYSSWINQVERLFAYVTADLLQRSDHRSVQALEADIRSWVKAWNDNPKPFIWTKTAEQILSSLARLLQRTTGAGH